jgi:hypothetical protein
LVDVGGELVHTLNTTLDWVDEKETDGSTNGDTSGHDGSTRSHTHTQAMCENAYIQMLFDVHWLFGTLRVQHPTLGVLQKLVKRISKLIDPITLSIRYAV